MKFRDFFGKGKLIEGAFVINLDSRVDRWLHVQSEFNRFDVLDKVEKMKAIPHHYGMVGCSLSHLECVKVAKQRGWKSVLIFEDDIVFKPMFDECVSDTLEQLSNKNWSVFHFGAMLMNISMQVDKNLLRIGYNWAAHAILIHENVYDFIIQNYNYAYSEIDSSKPWGGHYPFDGFINKEVFDAGYEIYSAYPLLITQKPDYSDTWGCVRDYKDLIEQSYKEQIAKDCNVLIFSKNRPMQLDATLKSYFEYGLYNKHAKVNILYTCSNEYISGYEILINKYKDRVSFIKETDFLKNVKDVVEDKKYIMFLVDDAIFYRPFSLSDGCEHLSVSNEVFSFSFRLGCNITQSFINGINHGEMEEYKQTCRIYKINWTGKNEYIDFGYPFEVSSSMYRSEDVVKIFSFNKCGWDNPNCFELTGTTEVRKNRNLFGKYIATYKKGTCVSIPLNRVQHCHLNRCMEDSRYSVSELNKKYVDGWSIDTSIFNPRWSSSAVHVMVKPDIKVC